MNIGSYGPKVSIGMPVFNGEAHVCHALDSILSQDFEDFELVISDNASTDRTQEICRDYASRDKRIRLHTNQYNIGAIPNHNLVFRLSRAKYFKWAAHDDEHLPTMLSRSVSVLDEAPPSVALVYPQSELIDDNGKSLRLYATSIECRKSSAAHRLGAVVRHIGLGTPIYGLFRADLLAKTRLHLPFQGSDYVLLAEVAIRGQIWEIKTPLLRKRMHVQRSTAAFPGYREWMAWADTSRELGRRWLSRDDKIEFEYLRCVAQSHVSRAEKIQCVLAVIKNSQAQRNRLSRWRVRLGLKREVSLEVFR